MGEWMGPPGSAQHKGLPDNKVDFAEPTTRWRQAINRALSEKGTVDRAEKLYEIAGKLIECATDKESPHYQFAVKEIGLRLDGKPQEHIQIGADQGSAAAAIGISAAFAVLVRASTGGEIIDGEVIVPDRSLLPAEVRTGEG